MRWLVDGMNVIGSRPDAWWKDRHGAMVRLVDMLERFATATGEDVIVVSWKIRVVTSDRWLADRARAAGAAVEPAASFRTRLEGL